MKKMRKLQKIRIWKAFGSPTKGIAIRMIFGAYMTVMSGAIMLRILISYDAPLFLILTIYNFLGWGCYLISVIDRTDLLRKARNLLRGTVKLARYINSLNELDRTIKDKQL